MQQTLEQIDRAKQTYQDELARKLEPEHTGEIVAIELGTNDYFVGEDEVDAADKARAAGHAGALFFLTRGFPLRSSSDDASPVMQMDGYFNVRDEPVIGLDVGSSQIEFLVDTGFNGGLIIPEQMAEGLDIKYDRGLEEFQSVTGEMFLADAYSMRMDWLGKSIRVPVATSKEVNLSLLGSHLLKGCCLTIDYGNRTVTIIKS